MNMQRKLPSGKQDGVVAIEFAMGFPIFLFMCIAWFELCYLSYISALTDYVVAHSSRESKSYVKAAGVNAEQFYQVRFKEILMVNDSFWADYVDVNKFKIKISYFNDLAPLIKPCVDKSVPVEEQKPNDNCLPEGENSSKGAAIALYSVEYQYRPLMMPLLNKLMLMREVIAVQEHERCSFDISGSLNCEK